MRSQAIRCVICGHRFPPTEDVIRRLNELRRKGSPYVCLRCTALQAHQTRQGVRSKGGF